jgi:TatD-related deoxyribonuclease
VDIWDNHVHLSAEGRNLEAIREFHRLGGTHILLVHLPYPDLAAATLGHFREGYARTLAMAGRVRAETPVKAYVAVGPYPVEILGLAERHPLEQAKEVMMAGIDDAARLVEEEKAVAIGEVGRPHFPVDEEVWEASNEILEYAMGVARDVGCPVVLHTESPTPETFAELGGMADRAGLPRARVVKHFSPPFVKHELNHGLFPSVIASEANLREALAQGHRFLPETDYLDDPRRPGAVLGIGTVPKKTKKLMQEGVLSPEVAQRIHGDNPRTLYQLG